MKILKPLILAALLPLTTACTGVNLEPATGANQIGSFDAAVSTVDGVRMVVNPNSWLGEPGVSREVTPIEVTIQNNSNKPLSVQYSEFRLVAPDGTIYNALPPFAIQGSLDKPVTAIGYRPILDPVFDYDNFSVAPYYASLYPTLLPYEGAFYPDRAYYDYYGPLWRNIQLPTDRMVAQALPEGVIENGGEVKGFLYFEKVDTDDDNLVKFRADLVNPRTGQTFGAIGIPFTVEKS